MKAKNYKKWLTAIIQKVAPPTTPIFPALPIAILKLIANLFLKNLRKTSQKALKCFNFLTVLMNTKAQAFHTPTDPVMKRFLVFPL